MDQALEELKGKISTQTSSSPSVKKPKSTVSKPVETASSVQPGNISYVKQKENSGTSNAWIYALIAIIALALATLGFIFFKNQNQIIEEKTQELERIVALSDGSEIHLGKFSTLTYNKNIDKQDTRLLTLDGEAKFTVVKGGSPFLVDYNGLMVRTLGTVFRVSGSDDGTNIECIEGRIRCFEKDKEEDGINIEEGEQFNYLNGQFIDVTPEPEPIPEPVNEETFTLGQVLDMFMEKSDWKIMSAASMPFDGDAEVDIDPEQSYQELMDDLQSKLDFEYKEAPCDGCFVITKLQSKPE